MHTTKTQHVCMTRLVQLYNSYYQHDWSLSLTEECTAEMSLQKQNDRPTIVRKFVVRILNTFFQCILMFRHTTLCCILPSSGVTGGKLDTVGGLTLFFIIFLHFRSGSSLCLTDLCLSPVDVLHPPPGPARASTT